MVALHQRWESADEPTEVTLALAEVARLEAGLSRALLSMPASALRRLATDAARADAAVARWEARVGERPLLDADAAAEVEAAVEAMREARADHDLALVERHKVLALGNVVGLSALAVAGGLVTLFDVAPMDLPVAVAVISAGCGPLTAGWLSTQRCSAAARRVGDARVRWAAALDATGVGSMGELAARRLAVAAWERRCREAAAVAETARPFQRAWHRVAGPGVSPVDIDDVLARVEQLRAALLRLLDARLAERVEHAAMAVLTPADELAAPGEPPSWLVDALSKLCGSRLRLWGA